MAQNKTMILRKLVTIYQTSHLSVIVIFHWQAKIYSTAYSPTSKKGSFFLCSSQFSKILIGHMLTQFQSTVVERKD